MAQDGSQQWEDKGAFSYLMHHPTNPQHTESYRSPGSRTNGGQAVQAETAQANTGTWNGPAPPGGLGAERSQNVSSTSIPDSILLPGGGRLPLLGYGTYKVKSPEAVKHALNIGYRHFDCARVYKNEDIIGEGLKDFLNADQQNRSKLFITSKVWNDARTPELVRKSIDTTLQELGCEYLDLYLIHWPEVFKQGTDEVTNDVPIKDTWQTLEALVDEGKTRYIGVSNFSLTDIEDLLEYARIKPVCNQIELHPALAQRKLVGASLRKGINSVAYSPLGHSDLFLLTAPEVNKIAEEVGKTPAQVLLKWNVQRGVTVIPKSSQEKHIRENYDGLFTWELNPAQKAVLDKLDTGERKIKARDFHSWDDPALNAMNPSAAH